MNVIDFDSDPNLLTRFLVLPQELYGTDSNWLRNGDEARWLSVVAKRKFLAMIGNKTCGRAAVMVNPDLCDEEHRPYGQIGFFECVNDQSAATGLMDAALAWLRLNEPGVQTVLAPINFDTWHTYRLRTSGFDESSFLMEPYNPPYYPVLFSGSGFITIARYLTKTVDDPSSLMAAWEPHYRNVIGRGFSFRPLDPTQLPGEMALIYSLSLEIFRDNLFFADISEAEFHQLYAGTAGGIDPDLLIFMLDPDGEPMGFCFTVPDHRQQATVNLKTMGVLPGEKGTGAGAALAYETYQRLRTRGLQRVNHCLMRAGNRADQFDRGHGKITREYELYARPLRP